MKMGSKTYLVRFKNPAISTQPVIASRAEIQGDHIVMLDAEDRLVALFWMSIVESWSEIPRLYSCYPFTHFFHYSPGSREDYSWDRTWPDAHT